MVATDLTGQLAQYMAGARSRSLPAEVAQAGKHRILDSLGAIVSGARLKAGDMAIRYVGLQGGTPEASVLATNLKTSAVNAALANGMFGHADETDDFEPVTKPIPDARWCRRPWPWRSGKAAPARRCSAPLHWAMTSAAGSSSL